MIRKEFFLLFFLLFSLIPVCQVFAGMGPPGPPMGPPPCWPPPCTVPLDGGISILIAAGAGLAGKKFYDMRKSRKNDQ